MNNTKQEHDKIDCKNIYDLWYELTKQKFKNMNDSEKEQVYKQFKENFGMDKNTCKNLIEYLKDWFDRYNKDELFECLWNSNEFSFSILLLIFVIIGRYYWNKVQ